MKRIRPFICDTPIVGLPHRNMLHSYSTSSKIYEKDHYKVLGVSRQAKADEIKRAYLAVSMAVCLQLKLKQIQ